MTFERCTTVVADDGRSVKLCRSRQLKCEKQLIRCCSAGERSGRGTIRERSSLLKTNTNNKKNVSFPLKTTRRSEGDRRPLKKEPFTVHSTATELGRDLDIRRDVSKPPLLAPQPSASK